MRFERITINPAQMGGQPCIRGRRIPVATVVAMVPDGMTADEVVKALPDLDVGDVSEALHYAAALFRRSCFLSSIPLEIPGRSMLGHRGC
ncbi:MAG: DUF433 domain-containing protein [Acidimicrobiales bacterium]